MRSSALAAGLRHLRGQLSAEQHSDEQLLRAFLAERDDIAFAALVRRHGPLVLHVCRRVLGHEQDAEDAFQATFLVLARKAARLRKKTSLASWLHGIAYRIALKAKQSAARRRKHEGRAPARPNTQPSSEVLWSDVRAMLDEEIARLPEKYRCVFVLLYLEECSREETARRLGLKEGTVASRLDQARKRLRRRLARRGVELTAVLAASALAGQPTAALSPLLLATTVKAVSAGEGGNLISAHVAALAKETVTSLIVSKVKIATLLLMAATVLGSVGLCFLEKPQVALVPSAEPPAGKAEETKTAASRGEAAKTVEIQGRVFGPDGKPKAGAKILLLGPLDPNEVRELLLENGTVEQLGVSAPDGRFTVAVPKTKERMRHYLIAQHEGTGIDFLDVNVLKPEKPIEFRLVNDHVIRGRIVNTEGKPVAGVRVTVNQLSAYPNNSLDSFLVYWKNRPFNFGERGSLKDIWSGASALLTATTDADGQFVLHGVGAERFLSLRLSGGIAADEVWVINRAGFDPKPYNQATLDNLPKGKEGFHGRWMLSGPDVSIVADAEKIIRGVVTEADTGKGRPGVIVRLKGKTFDNRAITDAQGRYEIRGARKAKSYRLEVASDATTGYLGCAVWVEDTLGYRAVNADIRTRKGVIVTGRMIDQATGKPLDGYVLVADLFGNPFVKEYSGGEDYSVLIWATQFWPTDANGFFRAVTIPGSVLLMGGPGRNKWVYKSRIPDPDYPQFFSKRGGHYDYRGSGFVIVQGNFCKVLQIKPDVAEVRQDIVLERLNPRGVVKIQDAEGRPLIETDAWGAANQIEGDSCTVYGEGLFLVFYEPKRKLAATLSLKVAEKLPPVVKLRPMGSAKGRLLDADGKPLEGIVVTPRYTERSANGIESRIYEGQPIASNANGDFALDSLIPELPFELSFRRGRREFAREAKANDLVIQVKPGEVRNVGAIRLKMLPEKSEE